MTEPLSPGEKLLNQRFMAEKCVTEQRAQKIWEELQQKGKMDGSSSSSLEESLVKCNAALESASINLEVVGIVFPHPTSTSNGSNSEDSQDDNEKNDDDENDDEPSPASASQRSKRGMATTTKYLAMIHKHTPQQNQDQRQSPSQLAFVKSCLGGPVTMNHRRAILEHLVQHTTAPRSALINLKNNLKNTVVSNENDIDNANTATTATTPNMSYTLNMAENCVDEMLQEQWLVDVGALDGNRKNRRISMQSQLALGPRTFMELSDVLTEQFGMDESALPQQLFYR